ncbi:unnamed protein product [Caenorhabditis angaria]|uniref:Carboxylic ester hydrolase n=1 Tax=Caenorhabditis angaria TaxID=860376 RepID=A0A9P1J195_9PELO|nr:unnamed protein product [Caenorhabditis angaria]
MWWLITTSLLFAFVKCDDPKVDVVISSGNVSATIRGYQHPYGTSFRGIPYAAAPVGLLRFREAQRKDPTGFVSALGYGNICVQPSGTGSEDCLFINVFSPNNASVVSKLPVYVYIHGGGFIEGSGNMGAGIYPNLVNKGNIILVTINYRLGPFGFFSTRETMAPGNWAISDWIEGLNWVQRYITFFGGDPSRVTIGGQSSGAEAVSILTLTSLAKGLYKQAIMESGSAFGAAIMSYSQKTRDTSKQLSIKANCATSDRWESGTDFGIILNCLRGLTLNQINTIDRSLPNHRMKWAIVQDKKYLTERLEYLALKRDTSINVLLGDVNQEDLGGELHNIEHNLNSTHNTGTQLKTDLGNSYEMTYWDNSNAVKVAAYNKYITNQNWADNDHANWEARRIQLWSEMIFIGPVLRDGGYFQYRGNNVYLYSLDWLSPNALPQITNPLFRGCMHTWELQYIFSTNCNGFNCTAQDELLRNYFTTTWLNFIKFGNPTPAGSSLPFTWLTMGKQNRYLKFQPNPTMYNDYHPDSNFWACTAPTIDGYKPPFC